MISVTITRDDLENHGACESGLRLFDELCAIAGTKELRYAEWTPLHSVWLAVAWPNFAEWLRDERIVPIADLGGANLRNADLSEVNLSEADLSEVNLRGANLRGATLRGANLRGATLHYADLRGADLSEVNLEDANLRGANLHYADLSEVNLEGAQRDSDPPAGWVVVDGRLRRRVS